MDDFLHNLRSGKLKQPDRGRREYTDYKGPQRRAPSDRRRTDYYAKVTNENFSLVKDSLDLLVENQKRIADALANGNKSESRIADALEAIATMMGRQWGHEDLLPRRGEPTEVKADKAVIESPVPAEGAGNLAGLNIGNGKLNVDDKPRLLNAIAAMRNEGDSWESIARHLDEQEVPTLTGKGKWRGTAIKKFWDSKTEDAGS
ncbi:hypothetical protein [Desulfosarcina sp.]|uniref:hypothetical protein n=1 Tax=Desulfosarcina sp. TaxID=2027861 RepID=UPI0039706674